MAIVYREFFPDEERLIEDLKKELKL